VKQQDRQSRQDDLLSGTAGAGALIDHGKVKRQPGAELSIGGIWMKPVQ